MHWKNPAVELYVLPRTGGELNDAIRRARSLVTRRAALASASVLVPIPGFDVAADVGTLMRLIPEINQSFGLTPDQIGRLNPRLRAVVYQAILIAGSTLIGKVMTTQLVFAALKKAGMKLTVKQVTKYVPVAGQALSAAISFAALKYVCHQHIRDCVRVVETLRTRDVRSLAA
jgi:hypothetical protein